MIVPSVFISYSNKDYEFVNQILNLLRSVNINCWIDIWGIQTGEDLSSSIIEAIKENDFVLCYLTENSIRSKWVALEVKEALENKREEAILFFIDSDKSRDLLERSALYSMFPNLTNKRIPVLNPKRFHLPLMEFISKIWSILPLLRYRNITPDLVLDGANNIGLNSIKYGSFTIDDDNKMSNLIMSASSIYFMGYNGGSFSRRFSEELKFFFKKPKSNMKVLLSTPNTKFYDEHNYLTSKSFYKDERDWREMENVKLRLQSYCDCAPIHLGSSLEVRQYSTQLRNPMLIFDEEICLITISIPPVESFNSATFEIGKINNSNSFLKNIIKHFNAVWQVAVLNK